MPTPLVSRLRSSCLLSLSLIGSLAGADAFADTLRGIVVDPDGRPVPRAYVRADVRGFEAAAGFTSEAGRFALVVGDSENCMLAVSLAGFEPAEGSCTAPVGGEIRIALALAPVRDAVLVSATRTDAPASQVGASATVFSGSDLQRRQMPLVADLLRLTPGAAVVRNGAPGSQTSLFVRGGESNYNKVLLDGIPLNEPGGTFYLNSLSTEHLDRIEVIRGAYSSLFGSDAMASVVQLFTHRAERGADPRVTAQLDGGSYGTLHASAAVSGATSAIDYSLGVARLDSDHRVPNSSLANTSVSGNVGVCVAADTTLRVIARAALERAGTPGRTAFGRPDRDAFFDRDDTALTVALDRQGASRSRHRAAYSIAASTQTSTNLIADPPFVASYDGRTALFESSDFTFDSRNRFRRHHAEYQGDIRIGASSSAAAHILTVLADWDGERATLENRLAGSVSSAARDNFGAAVQHQALWPRLFVTLGARVDHNENFGAAVVPRAAVVAVAREGRAAFGATRVKASAGRGIKEPTILQSFSTSPYFLGNPDLDPERSRSVELGVEQRFAGDRLSVDATWFDNRYADIISLQTTNPATFEARYFNIGLTRARGLELAAAAAPVRGLQLRAGYTFLDSEILESTSTFNEVFRQGQWAFWRPRHSGYAGVTVEYGRAALDVSGSLVGEFVDSDFGLFSPPLFDNRHPGHSLWDARLSYRLTRQLTGLVMIDNLTGADFMQPFGYQPLGRRFRAGGRVGF